MLLLGNTIALWIFRKRVRRRALAIVGILACVWIIAGDIEWNPLDDPAALQPPHLTLLSYNVQTFSYKNTRIDSIAAALRAQKPDVICLQEFRNVKLKGKDEKTDSYFAKLLGMEHYKFVALPIHIQGVAIFSKYPIVEIDTLFMPEEEVNSGFLATVQMPQGKVGIANLHMSSFHLSKMLDSKQSWSEQVLAVGRKTSRVVKLQEANMNKVIHSLSDYGYPLVLAADMNAVPHTRTLSQLRGIMDDTFQDCGRGLGWSFPVVGPLGLRIDYQFHSKEIEALSLKVLPMQLSDHQPLVGKYRFVQ